MKRRLFTRFMDLFFLHSVCYVWLKFFYENIVLVLTNFNTFLDLLLKESLKKAEKQAKFCLFFKNQGK